MATCRPYTVVLICVLWLAQARADNQSPQPIIEVTTDRADGLQSVMTGRIHVEAQDGGMLLEDRSGRIHSLLPTEIVKRKTTDTPFSYLPVTDASANLLQRHGSTFAIHETDHFLLCSDASDIYTVYCGKLLESVLTKYQAFFRESAVTLNSPATKLQVVIFRNPTTFSEHARQQHPETDFSDVPGYYSIRDNQMLVTAVSGDRLFRRESDLVRELKKNRRQVETLVHEVIHQLAFNTGLQVRYAANPMWLSEGFAVYFEGTSGSGPLAWNRPGETSRTHLPTLKRLQRNQPFPIALESLLGSDSAFQMADQAAFAYAEAWALTHYLIVRKREAFDRLLISYQQARPLSPISSEQQIERFEQATGLSLPQVAADLRRHFGRLRVPR